MKKILFAFMVSVLASCLLRADLVREEIAPNSDKPNFKTIVWLRDGVKIMSQTRTNSLGVSLCRICPFKPGAGDALTIWFQDGKIASAFSGPALNGYSFAIDDFTRDGVPDFIQITEQKVENHVRKLVAAYTIVNGVVEPLPDRLLKSDHTEFYYDDEIVAYLKEKLNEANRTNQRKAP